MNWNRQQIVDDFFSIPQRNSLKLTIIAFLSSKSGIFYYFCFYIRIIALLSECGKSRDPRIYILYG